MPKSKQTQIKARTTPEFKCEVETFSSDHNTNTSALIIAALQTYMHSAKDTTTTQTTELPNELKINLIRNKIMNVINLEPNIPTHTKQKIKKELNKID